VLVNSLAQDSNFQLLSAEFDLRLNTLSLLDMLKPYAFGFYNVALALEKLRLHAGVSRNSKVDKYDRPKVEAFFDSMKEECEKLDLKHTLNLTLGIEAKYRRKIDSDRIDFLSDKYTQGDLLNDLDALDISFSNELREELIFRIPSERKKYLEQDTLFGRKVAAAFPSSIDNIRNAGTCFAVEQWDAWVFHLMLVLENAFRVLATKFSVPFNNTTWHTIIEQIEKNVRGMNSSLGPDWKEQQKFCSAAASQFMFLKNAWRNHIMHLSDVYDEGKALSVLTHVRELMRILAKGGLHE
jgi:hypothetical protein